MWSTFKNLTTGSSLSRIGKSMEGPGSLRSVPVDSNGVVSADLPAPAPAWSGFGSQGGVPKPTRLIGNVTIRLASKPSALTEVWNAVSARRGRIFAFCNAHTISMAARSRKLHEALQAATVFNDGVGIDIASRIVYGEHFVDNLNGTDFVPALFDGLQQRTRVFLLGSPPGVAEIASENIMRRYAMVDIVGVQHGFFADSQGAEIVRAIRSSEAQLVLVGMGHPRQEIWSHEVVDQLDAVLLCIGAFIDFSANRVSRAPAIVRKMRAEWLYRFSREPRRLFRRYTVGTASFFAIIIAQKLRRRQD